MRRWLAGVALALASPAVAQDVSTTIAEGSIGPYRAGLNITVEDKVRPVAAHYYYASKGVDIPLTVGMAGEVVTLDEAGGGHFELRLTNADAQEPRPLSFYTATGLAGTWQLGDKVLPVQFGFTTGLTTNPVRWYGDVTSESDVAFEARVRRFLQGVTSGNRAQAAAAVSYPLRVNRAKVLVLRNRKQFLAAWDKLFTPDAVAQLRKAIPHEMFVRNGMAMVSGGAVWFDAKGAKVLNL